MAYPTIDAPYGLRPIGMIGGHSYAGSTRKIPIASNYGTALFYGDVVQYKNDGTIIITTLQNDTSVVAVVADDIEAYVCDDPNVLFKVVNCTGASADGAASGLLPAFVSRANAISCNAELVLNTGVTASGNSRMGVFINNVATILPITVVDVVPDTKNSDGNFVEFIVKFTQGYQRYQQTAGV